MCLCICLPNRRARRWLASHLVCDLATGQSAHSIGNLCHRAHRLRQSVFLIYFLFFHLLYCSRRAIDGSRARESTVGTGTLPFEVVHSKGYATRQWVFNNLMFYLYFYIVSLAHCFYAYFTNGHDGPNTSTSLRQYPGSLAHQRPFKCCTVV